MDDAWAEFPAVNDSIVRTRFEEKNPPPYERDTESGSRVTAAEHIWYPTRAPFSPVNRLQQDWRSGLTPLNDPLKLPSFKGGLSADVG